MGGVSSSGGTEGILASRVPGCRLGAPGGKAWQQPWRRGAGQAGLRARSSPRPRADQSCRWTLPEVEKPALFTCPYFVCVCVCVYIFALWHLQHARQSEAFSKADLCQSFSWDHVESPAMSDSGCELSQMAYGRTWEAGGAVEPQLWLEIVHGCAWHVLSRTA